MAERGDILAGKRTTTDYTDGHRLIFFKGGAAAFKKTLTSSWPQAGSMKQMKEIFLYLHRKYENMKHWYAIYVRPRAEKKVAKSLSDAGIDHYLPLQRSLRKWSDRKKWIDMPLIPGYCFVHIDLADRIQVLTLPNVLQFVRFAGQPAMIQPSHIEFMKRMLSQTEVDYTISDQMPAPGQTVEIISGPMIGLQAEMICEKGRSRIIVRLEALGNIIQVEVPLTQVALLGNAVPVKR